MLRHYSGERLLHYSCKLFGSPDHPIWQANGVYPSFQYAICMLILFGLQLALSIWIFAANDKFLTSMGKVVDKAMDENDAAQGYPMDALQLAVSTPKLI